VGNLRAAPGNTSPITRFSTKGLPVMRAASQGNWRLTTPSAVSAPMRSTPMPGCWRDLTDLKGRYSAPFTTTAPSPRSITAEPPGRRWYARRAPQSNTLAKSAFQSLQAPSSATTLPTWWWPPITPSITYGSRQTVTLSSLRARSRRPNTGHSSSPNSLRRLEHQPQVGCRL